MASPILSPASPRWATQRRPERETFGDRLALVATEMSQSPLPWQQQVFDVAGELLTREEAEEDGVPYGTPAYRQVWVTVPRQSGKTTIALVMLVDRCIMWAPYNARASRCIYTAQNGKAARKKLIKDMVPMMELSPAVRSRMGKVLHGSGSEEVPFLNGSSITLGSNSESAIHGETLDFAVIDEAFHDFDNRREGAISPTMTTRPMAQILGSSTAGTAASVYFNEKCRQGIQAVKENTGRGIAFFDWSAPRDADTYDESVWIAAHPAVHTGGTVRLSTMRDDARLLPEDEFRRAWLNIPSERIANQHIPQDRWVAVNSSTHSAMGSGNLRWAFDVTPSRSHTAIAAFNTDTSTGELVDHHPGTAWVAKRLKELTSKHGGHVVYDTTGPGANIGADHRNWEGVGSTDVMQSCATFHDMVVDGRIHIRSSGITDEALKAAEVRQSGDRWAWSRSKSSGDISPIVALTLAAAGPEGAAPKQKPFLL